MEIVQKSSLRRLNLLTNQVKASEAKHVGSALEWCGFDDYLTPTEKEHRLRIRKAMDEIVIPKMNKYVESTEFPFELISALRDLKICGTTHKEHGCPGLSPMMMAAVYTELFRADASVGTFFVVQNSLGIDALFLTASDEQLAQIIPKASKFEKILCFGLTEPEYGSDATSLETNVKKTKDGYLLNGTKRWIGNAIHADHMVCWARAENGKDLEGFIVDLKSKGVHIEKIQGKMSLRAVQNCEIHFKDVVIPAESRLAKTQDFATGAGKVLKHARVIAWWAAIGIAVSGYDHCIKYVSQRKQFGRAVSSFQLSQEKLGRMMGNIQGMIHYAAKITKSYFEGQATMGQITLCKAWCSLRGREVVALSRELLGGNGILLENQAIKAFMDMESVYTYEGTYDVNVLVAGRELTGISAFR